MTWEELCEKAKEMGYECCDVPGSNSKAEEITIPGIYHKKGVYFNMLGDVFIDDLSPEQMLAIMEALK